MYIVSDWLQFVAEKWKKKKKGQITAGGCRVLSGFSFIFHFFISFLIFELISVSAIFRDIAGFLCFLYFL